jgi:hypothetical protein
LIIGVILLVDMIKARLLLDDLFIRSLNGTGLGSPRTQSEAILARLRQAVKMVPFSPSTLGFVGTPGALSLDEERAIEVDEGWLPVVCADGFGVLVWDNSD